MVQLTVIQLKKKYKKLIVHGELLETQKYVFQHNNLQRFLDFVDVVTCIKKGRTTGLKNHCTVRKGPKSSRNNIGIMDIRNKINWFEILLYLLHHCNSY